MHHINSQLTLKCYSDLLPEWRLQCVILAMHKYKEDREMGPSPNTISIQVHLNTHPVTGEKALTIKGMKCLLLLHVTGR